jgi:ubiquitin thioesterase protein OTUB1
MEDDNQSQYKLTEQQLAQIEAEINSSQPLTSQLLPIDALIQQYSQTDEDASSSASGFLASSRLLATKYTNLRRIRGDGNCYYRAFLYSLCEGLLQHKLNSNNGSGGNGIDKEEYTRIKSLVHNSLSWVCTLGYEQSTIEMFYEEFVDLIDSIDNQNSSNEAMTTKTLHEKLNEENSTSDYCTWYLRVLTAAQMKSDPDRFLPFLLAEEYNSNGDMTVDVLTFCAREVEPMNKECSMV